MHSEAELHNLESKNWIAGMAVMYPLFTFCTTINTYHYFHFHLQLRSLRHSQEGQNKLWEGPAELLNGEQSDGVWSAHSLLLLQEAVRRCKNLDTEPSESSQNTSSCWGVFVHFSL